eukprot:1894871-Lingulodinium_polyedra.AAC.1
MPVLVANIENIKTFTYGEVRGILDVCACFIDWSSVKSENAADARAAQRLRPRATDKRDAVDR